MKFSKIIITAALFSGAIINFSGCVNLSTANKITTPYNATAQRAQQIINAKRLVRVNDTEERVVKIAGDPDEVRNISTSLDGNNKIGYAFIYILKRERDQGSMTQRREQNLKIIFNNKKIVTKIEVNGRF